MRQRDPIYEILYDIRQTAMDHPAFDMSLYETKDVEGLANVGGDTADWTMIALQANEAMELYEEVDIEETTNN